MDRVFNEISLQKEFELRSKLSLITNSLKLYDKISLIFLLCRIPYGGLKVMDLIFKETNSFERNNIFFNWLIEQNIFKCDDWQEKFSEHLSIIQNYFAAEILGYSKDILEKKFLPKQNLYSHSVLPIRKVLYNLCEALTQKDFNFMVQTIEKTHNSVVPSSNSAGVKYLEYMLLLWSEEGVINLYEDKDITVSALLSFLNLNGPTNFAMDIATVAENVNNQLLRKRAYLNADISLPEVYSVIDENNLGFCIIINEKVFSNPILTTRFGTEKDVERLTEVFTVFGLNIRVYSDLTYEQLIEKLGYYAKSIEENHSVFILIILSHGSENLIYTSDSQAVDMNTIEMIFQAEICPNLIGKPKIFIVQSCQGEKWQKILKKLEDSDICCDSSIPSTSAQEVVTGPQRGDSMIAWSTVQGFASFRDKFNGSWYIQELCKELWRFGDISDLVEIFTRVNNNLRSKVHNGQFMVPSMLLSLRAKVKLPYLKENKIKGKKLMFERLVFEKYFREFIKSNSQLHTGKFFH